MERTADFSRSPASLLALPGDDLRKAFGRIAPVRFGGVLRRVGVTPGDARRDLLVFLDRRGHLVQQHTHVEAQVSLALRATGLHKINHDVVVPRGRIPELFDVVDELRRDFGLTIACFGHAGDGNIHVNFMIRPDDAEERGRAKQAERVLFERVVALEGSISGEHGIGFAKAPYLSLELDAAQIALLKRVKAAFDPHGILNPGKIF